MDSEGHFKDRQHDLDVLCVIQYMCICIDVFSVPCFFAWLLQFVSLSLSLSLTIIQFLTQHHSHVMC